MQEIKTHYTPDNLLKSVQEAINGCEEDTVFGKTLACHTSAGFLYLSDGRKAEVKISIETDPDEWQDSEEPQD